MKYHEISAFSENYMYAPVTGQLQRDIRAGTRFAFRKKEDKLFLSLMQVWNGFTLMTSSILHKNFLIEKPL